MCFEKIARPWHSLADAAGYRVRLTSMGHAQRGGPASLLDRWLARAWGELAAMQLLDGVSGKMMIFQTGTIGTVPLIDVFGAPPKPIDRDRYTQING